MLNRRRFLVAGVTGLSLAAGTQLPVGVQSRSAAGRRTPTPVHEITMAAPDIVCLELRDGPFTHGAILPLPVPAADRQRGDWIERNGVWGRVIGPGKDHFRTSDIKPDHWVDRTAVDDPFNYRPIGELTVIAVYRKSVPYDSGIYRSASGETLHGASLKHYIYLKLGDRLQKGEHRLSAPLAAIQETRFTFSDTSRAISIRANQHGHRPGDQQKIGYLALWLPGGPENGAFSFEPYHFGAFNVIDASGTVVYSGPISLPLGPAVLESSEAALLTYQQGDGGSYRANRSGTFVCALDYSGWMGAAEGVYRLQIPNLGVSDPFLVSEAAWYAAARTSLAGLYHQRSGISLDGRFGYTRRANQRPDVTGPIFDSKLPYLFSSENSLGFIPFGKGAAAPWITDKPNVHAWGGYMDAGDWDRRAEHLQVANGMLLVYETIPETARDISWGIPKSSELLDRHLYAAIDDVPDLLHEAAFAIDIYRRMQDQASGAVRGGIESSNTPEHGEPSFLESHTTFVYAPDHQSAWRYAAAAARFARIMRDLRKDELAHVYRTSAAAAFEWAEGVHRNMDKAYEEPIALARASGAFGAKSWDARKSAIMADTKRMRASAAAALYRLDGAARHRDVFEALFNEGLEDFEEGGDARWDYANACYANANLDATTILDQFVTTANRYIVAAQTKATNYMSTKWTGVPMLWGQGNAPDYNQIQILVRAHARSRDPDFLKCMQAAMAHILGANQLGLCMTTGLGRRTIKHPLHEDHISMGVDAPAGITVYGYAPWQQTDYDWVWGPQHWAALPGTSGIGGQPDYEDAAKRKVHPFRKSMPLFEYFIEHPRQIMQQEYTVHQTINPVAMMALYLHAHDGNRAVAMPVLGARPGPVAR